MKIANERTTRLVEDKPDDEVLNLQVFRQNHIDNRITVARDGGQALDLLLASSTNRGKNASRMPALLLRHPKLANIEGLDALRRICADQRAGFVPAAR